MTRTLAAQMADEEQDILEKNRDNKNRKRKHCDTKKTKPKSKSKNSNKSKKKSKTNTKRKSNQTQKLKKLLFVPQYRILRHSETKETDNFCVATSMH